MSRIDWDNYFMKICDIIALRATCPRKSVGALVVKDNRIISTGYNGAPEGMKHCIDVGCKIVNNHCVRVVHAEMNALLFAGKDACDATLYCTCLPCEICLKMAVQQRIKRIVYKEDYNKESVDWIITESKIKVQRIDKIPKTIPLDEVANKHE